MKFPVVLQHHRFAKSIVIYSKVHMSKEDILSSESIKKTANARFYWHKLVDFTVFSLPKALAESNFISRWSHNASPKPKIQSSLVILQIFTLSQTYFNLLQLTLLQKSGIELYNLWNAPARRLPFCSAMGSSSNFLHQVAEDPKLTQSSLVS